MAFFFQSIFDFCLVQPKNYYNPLKIISRNDSVKKVTLCYDRFCYIIDYDYKFEIYMIVIYITLVPYRVFNWETLSQHTYYLDFAKYLLR